MIASLYQSGSTAGSLFAFAMRLHSWRNHKDAQSADYEILLRSRKGKNYFFGTAIAWAATHFHSPLRSIQVSVNRYAWLKVLPAFVLPVSFASPVTTATLSPNIRTCMSLETADV